MPFRILAFEPFDGGSHRAIRTSIQQHAAHDWRWFTRPARAWKWRMRTGAAELVDIAREGGAFDESWDAIFVSGLCGVTDLVALLPRALRVCPVIVYMHENQLEYPARSDVTDERDVHFALTNLNGLLAADRVLWNSAWNRDSFLDALPGLLRLAPDGRLASAPERIAERSVVAWPPVDDPDVAVDLDRVLHNPPRVVWPHRWEHDKGPDELRENIDRIAARWILLGERFAETPAAMADVRSHPAVEHDGFIADRRAYWESLAGADWVHSTARHEFFGLAVVEALLAGCLPWLPDRLSYRELLPPEARSLTPAAAVADPGGVRRRIREHLEPARSVNAVRRIEQEIETLISSSAHAGGSALGAL